MGLFWKGWVRRMDLVSLRPRLKEQLRIKVSAWMALEQGAQEQVGGGLWGIHQQRLPGGLW